MDILLYSEAYYIINDKKISGEICVTNEYLVFNKIGYMASINHFEFTKEMKNEYGTFECPLTSIISSNFGEYKNFSNSLVVKLEDNNTYVFIIEKDDYKWKAIFPLLINKAKEQYMIHFDPTTEIKKYKELCDKGLITLEEYNEKKKKLLEYDLSDYNVFDLLRIFEDAQYNYSKLLSQATKDTLTGLYNRWETTRLIEKFLSEDGALGTHALIMLDLDDLKKINDSLGHQVGDDVLKKIGKCLNKTFRQEDICGRIGGDEFFVFLKNVSASIVIKKVRSLLKQLQLVYKYKGEEIVTSISIGISMYHGAKDHNKTLKKLYSEADAALYKSKSLGKNTYTFADELDAVSDSSSQNLLKSDLITYNLRGLMDNLANGIAIFQGQINKPLVPVFCNAKLPELLKITNEEFFSHMSVENGYGIHPDDLAFAKQSFYNSQRSGKSCRDVFRLMTGDNSYRYVTVFYNLHLIDDENFDLYCIFSNAEEAEQLLKIQENRRKQRHNKRMQLNERDMAYAILDISNNKCLERYYSHIPLEKVTPISSAESLLEEIINDISIKEYREEFKKLYSLDVLKKDSDDGIRNKSGRYPFRRKNRSAQWYRVDTENSINPDTGSIEVFITFDDIDDEVRFGNIIDHMLEGEYEFLGHLDMINGYITKIGNVDDGYFGLGRHIPEDYRDIYKNAVDSLIFPEYREEAMEAFSIERIYRELENKNVYSFVYPTKADKRRGNRACRWRFEYLEESKNTVLISRNNVSEILDYGYDSLTGMLDKRGFCQKVKEKLMMSNNKGYFICEIDFDNFRIINEKYSYNEGNRLLRLFASDLRNMNKIVGSDYVVGHLEGDSFLLFVPMTEEKMPELIFQEIAMFIQTYPEEFRLKIRMGVYVITDHLLDVTIMIDCVHLALKACKKNSKDRIVYYANDLKDSMLDEQMLALDMQEALENEEFDVYFQPQINHAQGGLLIGAEALIRWNHPNRGTISPGVFIPLFEKNGSIYELDKYVWKKTCKMIRKWIDDGINPPPMSVNVSRLDVINPNFVETIVNICDDYNVPHELLHLEITESAFNENSGFAVDIVKDLTSRGFIVAIDDFGSGYSALSMLRSVPANILKLDMKFFQGEENATRNECIIESIVRMAKMLGMAVLAEGVEHTKQANLLKAVGCNYIQGYLYSKPLNVNDFEKYLKESTIGISDYNLNSPDNAINEIYSQELYRDIISGTNNIIIVADMNDRQLLYANRAAEKFYGVNFEPLNPITCYDFCGHDHKCDRCPAAKLKPGEKKEKLFVEKGVHFKSFYTRINWNNHDAFVFLQTDITNEIKETELLDSLVKNITVATTIMELTDKGRVKFKYVSDQFKALLSNTIIKDTWSTYEDCFKVLHKEDARRIKKSFKEAFINKSKVNEEFRVMLEDGKVMWIECTINPVLDATDNYIFYGVYNNITDRKDSQARADAMINNLPIALTIFQADSTGSKRILLNENAQKILGMKVDPKESTDMNTAYRHIHPEDEIRMRVTGRHCVETKEAVSAQFRVKGDDGEYRWVQLDATPIIRDNGEYLYYGVYTDINAQKILEKKNNK